jgi:hypothetical protein
MFIYASWTGDYPFDYFGKTIDVHFGLIKFEVNTNDKKLARKAVEKFINFKTDNPRNIRLEFKEKDTCISDQEIIKLPLEKDLNNEQ